MYTFPKNSDTSPISRSSLSNCLFINRLASHAPPAQRATLVFVPCQRVLALDACRTQQFLSSANHPLIYVTVATVAEFPDRHAEHGPMRSGLAAFFARTVNHSHSPKRHYSHTIATSTSGITTLFNTFANTISTDSKLCGIYDARDSSCYLRCYLFAFQKPCNSQATI